MTHKPSAAEKKMLAWADASCEKVYLINEPWPAWAQGAVIVIDAQDWKREDRERRQMERAIIAWHRSIGDQKWINTKWLEREANRLAKRKEGK